MEEDVEETIVNKPLDIQHWAAIEPTGLSPIGNVDKT